MHGTSFSWCWLISTVKWSCVYLCICVALFGHPGKAPSIYSSQHMGEVHEMMLGVDWQTACSHLWERQNIDWGVPIATGEMDTLHSSCLWPLFQDPSPSFPMEASTCIVAVWRWAPLLLVSLHRENHGVVDVLDFSRCSNPVIFLSIVPGLPPTSKVFQPSARSSTLSLKIIF